MAIESQLQLGEIEQMQDGIPIRDVPLPAPVAPVEGEEAAAPTLEPTFSPDELQRPVDAFSTAPLSPFETLGAASYAPMTLPQLEGVGEMLSRLSGAQMTIEDIRKAFNEGIFGTKVDDAITVMLNASDNTKKDAMLSVLNRGDITIPQRLEIIRELDRANQGPDMNAAERVSLTQLNEQENTGYDEAADNNYVESLKDIAAVPRLARAETSLSPEELQASFSAMLNMYVADTDKRAREVFGKNVPYAAATANFLPMLAPFFGTVPVVKILKEINRAAGGDIGMSTAAGAFLPGTALRTMREHIETLPLEEKVKTFARVMKVLQGNRAIFPTQNAHLQSYLIQNLFYKDMTGQDYIKEATPEENKAFIAAREQADRFNRQMAVETDSNKANQLAAQRNAWMEKARSIEAGASGRLWHQYNKVTFGQWLDDMAILDFTLLAPLARGTIKLGQKGALVGGAAKRLLIAPDATTKEWVTLLQDPAARKKLTGLLGEDVAETMLPAAIKGAEEAGIEGMGELLSRADNLRKEIRQTLREGSNVTAKVQREYVEELKTIFGSFTEKPTMHTTKSVFTPTADGVEVVARYGPTPTKTFATWRTAKTALDQLPVEGKIVRMNKDGTFAPITAMDDGKLGRYMIEVADKRTYDSSRAAWQEALFPREQVRAPWFLPVNSAIGGKAAKAWNWFFSSPDMFGPDIFNRLTSDVMRAAVVQKMHTGFVRTMLALPKKEQYMVSSLLKQGEEVATASGRGTTFTVQQIKAMHPEVPDTVIKSYYEARMLADEMYDLANGQMRAEYFREGVKSIHSTSGHVGFGRPLQTADEAIGDIKSAQNYTTLHVYDPETGTFSALKRTDIDALYAKGSRLVRMEELIQGKGFQEATHVIVDKSNRVKELPMNVLPRVNGYYPHIYASNYIIYGVSKAGNKVALSTAKTIADAKAEMARLSARMGKMKDAPYTTFDYKFDRSLRDPLTAEKDVGGPIFNPTAKVYGTRTGGTLANASKQYGDHMVDPVEALLRGMEIVSHSVTKGNLIKNMEARLYNTLRLVEHETGQKIIKDPTKLVKTPDDINYVSVASKDLQKATAYMQQIDMVRHIPDSVETQLAQILSWSTELFHALATKVAKVPLPGAKSVAADITRLEEKLATAASKGVDPMRMLTEMGHRVYIAGNPIQQFALQMSQALMVSGVAPRDLPLAMSKALPMQTLVNMRISMNSGANLPEAYKKALAIAAKLSGTTEAKLDKMVGVLERSGLIDTVSVHSQIRTAARSQATTRMLAAASTQNQGTAGRITMDVLRKLDDATFGNLSTIGFEAGEQLNRIATFLSLYQRDVRKGIANLDQPAYIQKLTGEVNTLVGAMLRETSMGYQRGWLKAAFQFVAFQHKMATMMLFSKNLSLSQKVGIGVSQFLLFGSRGAAHMDAFHRVMDDYMRDREAASPEEKSQMLEMYYSPEVQTALDGIVFDGAVNGLIRAIGGEDAPGFAWNRRLAPGGGSEMLVDAVMELRNNPVEKVFGLSGKHGSKLLKFANKVQRYMLASAKDMDDAMEPQDRFALLAKEGAALSFSGYNKYLQAAVMKNMGGAVSDTGNISMTSGNSYLERTLAAALGVSPEDRQAFLEATDKYYASIRNDPKRHKEAMDDLADQLYREIVTEMVKLKGEAATPEVFEDMETRLLNQKAMMLSFLTPHEAEVVSEKIGDKIAEAIKNVDQGNTAEVAFINDLTQDLRDGKFGDKEAMEWEVYLRRTPLFERYPQLMGEFREVRRQMLTYEDEEE